MRVYILNDHLELQPLRVIGNIFIAGVQVSRGYIHMLDTQTVFLPDLFVTSREGERMYRTGDMGYFDELGNVHYCGRKDRQIKLRGFRVNLDEVSIIACQQASNIRKAVATENNGSVVLWVEGDNVNTGILQAQLTKVLPKYTIPRFVAVMEKLPLSKNGKLDAKCLSERPLPNKRLVGSTTTLTAFESLIAREWRLLLGLDPLFPLSGSDSFPLLGGHSLLQLKLTARLSKVCNIPVTIKDVMFAPNLSSLATVVEQQHSKRNIDMETVAKEVDYKPLGLERLSPPETEWYHRCTHSRHQATFNVPYAADLAPEVDLENLATSIEAVCSRHRILHSRYILSNDINGVRRTFSDQPIKVHRADSFNINEFINRPFDLANDQLIRIILSSSCLAISIHHILIDLTGLRNLLSEITTLYHGSELQPVERDYFDVAWWNEEKSVEDTLFWSSYFNGLSLQRQAETKRSYRGTSLLAEIPPQLYQSILTLISQEAMSLHQIALAVTATLLHTLCDHQTDILLGSPYMNRSSTETQNIIGLFLEPVPFRIHFANQTIHSKAEMLQSVKSSSQSVLAHIIPWPQLLDDLNLPFPSETQQLFDCVVTVYDDRRDEESRALAIDGIDPVPVVWTEGAKFAALFEWHAFSDRLTLRLEYDTDLLTSGYARLLQELMLVAIREFVDPRPATCGDVIGRLREVFEGKCKEWEMDVGDVRAVARRALKGAG